jgi:hypothetical protein
MRTRIAVCCFVLAITPATAGERPVLVELFTSEGCSSCPPADRLLTELAARPDLLTLSFHVDYWDRLGWKDPFSSAAATRRQSDYARLLGLETIYTPQVVVDGHWQAVGADRSAVDRAIAAAEPARAAALLRLTIAGGTAEIVLAPTAAGRPARVLLVAFDRRHVDRVGGGENDGRLLSHVDVVRGIAEIGRFDGAPQTIRAPLPAVADRVAVILQADDGRIIALAVANAGPA